MSLFGGSGRLDQAYIDAGRAMFRDCEARGIAVFEPPPFDDNLTAAALEIFGGYFHPLVDAIDEVPATVWPAVEYSMPQTPKRRRRRWSDATLWPFPLTQPPNRCQRCGVVADGPLELDHMVELADDGIDHPYNLVRLCSTCHRSKPLFFELATAAEKRLAVLTWVFARPNLSWWDLGR